MQTRKVDSSFSSKKAFNYSIVWFQKCFIVFSELSLLIDGVDLNSDYNETIPYSMSSNNLTRASNKFQVNLF